MKMVLTSESQIVSSSLEILRLHRISKPEKSKIFWKKVLEPPFPDRAMVYLSTYVQVAYYFCFIPFHVVYDWQNGKYVYKVNLLQKTCCAINSLILWIYCTSVVLSTVATARLVKHSETSHVFFIGTSAGYLLALTAFIWRFWSSPQGITDLLNYILHNTPWWTTNGSSPQQRLRTTTPYFSIRFSRLYTLCILVMCVSIPLIVFLAENRGFTFEDFLKRMLCNFVTKVSIRLIHCIETVYWETRWMKLLAGISVGILWIYQHMNVMFIFLSLSVIWTLMECCNNMNNLLNVGGDIQDFDPASIQMNLIQNFKYSTNLKIYWKRLAQGIRLRQLFKIVNQLFGLHFLFNLIGIMPSQAVALVHLFDGQSRRTYVKLLEMLTTLIPLTVAVLSAIVASKTVKIRDWFMPAVIKGEVRLHGKILCYEITSHQVALSAHGFFTINYAFLTSMITSVLVHATIVIQFQQHGSGSGDELKAVGAHGKPNM